MCTLSCSCTVCNLVLKAKVALVVKTGNWYLIEAAFTVPSRISVESNPIVAGFSLEPGHDGGRCRSGHTYPSPGLVLFHNVGGKKIS